MPAQRLDSRPKVGLAQWASLTTVPGVGPREPTKARVAESADRATGPATGAA